MGRIFVIDDEQEVAAILACVLEQEGHEVTAFTSAKEALATMRADPPALAFIDLLMPEIDGGALCRLLKSERRTAMIRVVLLSGYGYLEREARDAGADECMGKPFDLDTVVGCAERWLGEAERTIEAR